MAKTPKAHYKTTIVIWTLKPLFKAKDHRPLETVLAEHAGDVCQARAHSQRLANPLTDAEWDDYRMGGGVHCIHDVPAKKAPRTAKPAAKKAARTAGSGARKSQPRPRSTK